METCSICHRTIANGPPYTWRTEDDVSVSVGTSAEPIVLIGDTGPDIWVCETCYLGEFAASLPPIQQRELHREFATEYRSHGQLHKSLRADEHALALGDCPDILASLAYTHGELGNNAKEEALYRRALELDPHHLMSINNLRLLPQPEQNDG